MFLMIFKDCFKFLENEIIDSQQDQKNNKLKFIMKMKNSLKKLFCCKKNTLDKDLTKLKVEEILNTKVLKISKD